MGCLDEKTLSSYLDELGRSPAATAERRRIEAHVSSCNNCLDLLLVAYEAQRQQCGLFRRLLRPCYARPRNDKIMAVIARSKAVARRSRSKLGAYWDSSLRSEQAPQSRKKRRTELKWLLGAVFSFALSFAFKRYFAQFLVAAAILGFKWVMEGGAAKRAIMIFKGIEKGQKKIEPRSKF